MQDGLAPMVMVANLSAVQFRHPNLIDLVTRILDKVIVIAIINLDSSLGVRTIAEGVETASQLAFLRLQGCDEVQWNYFSQPLPKDQLEAFVRSHIS